jgi:hypothetical protein
VKGGDGDGDDGYKTIQDHELLDGGGGEDCTSFYIKMNIKHFYI